MTEVVDVPAHSSVLLPTGCCFIGRRKFVVAIDFLRQTQKFMHIMIWILKEILCLKLQIKLKATTPGWHVYVAHARSRLVPQDWEWRLNK